MISSKMRVKRKSVPWQIMEGKVLILSPEQKQAHELNETATLLWQSLDGEVSVGELAGRLKNEFSISEQQAVQDTLEFVQELLDNDLADIQ